MSAEFHKFQQIFLNFRRFSNKSANLSIFPAKCSNKSETCSKTQFSNMSATKNKSHPTNVNLMFSKKKRCYLIEIIHYYRVAPAIPFAPSPLPILRKALRPERAGSKQQKQQEPLKDMTRSAIHHAPPPGASRITATLLMYTIIVVYMQVAVCTCPSST